MNKPSEQNRRMVRENATVVVITPMNLEYKAMRTQLVDLRQRWHPEGTLFEVGSIPGIPWQVALIVTGEGNANAAVLAERAINEFKPRLLLVVGIAGGLKDDIELGDVVVATWIHDYHGGKEDDDGFRARPRGWGAAHRLEQVARMVDFRDEWTDHLPSSAKPTVHFKPIAAGDIVLNSRNSALAVQLRSHYNDAAAIEMESAGTGTAAHLNASLPVLTIRGISDKADGEKHLSDAAGLQPRAASHAAVFAAAFLEELAIAEESVSYDTAPELAATDETTWRPLDAPLATYWLSDLGLDTSNMSAALELHVVPIAPSRRLEARRLTTVKEELAALGQAKGLFTSTEGLRTEAPAAVVSPSGAGLAVTRDGQRSVWQPLPADMFGAVLDAADLVGRLTELLALLVTIKAPITTEVGLAIGLTRTYLVAEGRVSDLPRTGGSIPMSSAPLRVPADDALLFSYLTSDTGNVAEELCARLLHAFRTEGR
ncbi:phosphorylase family protein [Sphaerisporangium rhizosphaerae]|uniref:Purine phosphorylase n=1 Tax=Sphaerisporangium rhizosphaerae TaxID=2269375 RepID=A0ABW2NVT9_9ACTN